MATNADTHPPKGSIDYSVVETDAPIHPNCRRLLDYWRERLKADGLMRRVDFNPLEMPSLMGGMFIVEPVDGGKDMRYRLVGTENEQRLGMKFTGRRFTECYAPRMAAEQIAFHSRIIATRKPSCLRGNFVNVAAEHANFEAIYLPAQAGNGEPQIVGGVYDLAEQP
ncbi:MAG: PAS domain-containing protein [Parvibaculum sp.]|nr:PAS domain-containing protein [Parvibaculum sp.]